MILKHKSPASHYQHCLTAKTRYNISDFLSPSPSIRIFPILSTHRTLPDFFKTNLLSEYRVIKHLRTDPHSNIRIFYYQLLRVCFEIRRCKGHNWLYEKILDRLIECVYAADFEIYFTPDTENQKDVFNDFQFKVLLAQFLERCRSQKTRYGQGFRIEEIINSYPIIDSIFIHIFRTYLSIIGIGATFDDCLPCGLVFNKLSFLLGVSVCQIGKCYQFVESDLFCYVENEGSLYMAYVELPGPKGPRPSINFELGILEEESNSSLVSSSICQPEIQQISEQQQQVQSSKNSQNYEYFREAGNPEIVHSLHQLDSVESKSEENYFNSTKGSSVSSSLLQRPPADPQKSEHLHQTFKWRERLSCNNKPRKSRFVDICQASTIKEQSIGASSSVSELHLNPVKDEDAVVSPQKILPPDPEIVNLVRLKRVSALKLAKLDTFLKCDETVVSLGSSVADRAPLSPVLAVLKGPQANIVNTASVGTGVTKRRDELGDYYDDFTNTFLLQHIAEPYRSTIRKIKDNMRGMRKPIPRPCLG